jgi:apolipoprotein D and lipocalin family protein
METKGFSMKYFFGLFIILGSFSSCASNSSNQEVKVVNSVNLERYIGTWYEVASIPMRFQNKCTGNATAEYSLDDDLIAVVNSCDTKGERAVAHARAKVTDPKTNAKLKVTFVKVFTWLFFVGGEYWILDLDEDYSFAVIGDSKSKYGWVLSREPVIEMEKLKRAERVFKDNGYDTCLVLTSIQDKGFRERKPLCEMIN